MYAVISSGGKQYRLCEGDVLELESLSGDVGDRITLEDVLYVGGDQDVLVGAPLVENARVLGTIMAHERGDKVTVFKFKRRKMYRRKRGHRQQLTRLRVDSIEVRALQASEDVEAGTTPEAAPEPKGQKKITKGRKAPSKAKKEQSAEE